MLNKQLATTKQVTAAHFSKAAACYSEHAHVQKQAADILLKSLDGVYDVALDLGCGPFVNSFPLKKQVNTLISADLSETMLASKVTPSVCADMDSLPFQANSFDLVFSNFAMQWSSDLANLLKQIAFVLKPGAKAHFSLVADGTLSEIEQCFANVDNQRHINRFATQSDIQAALSQSGMRLHTISFCHHKIFYGSAKEALGSIKAIGANHQNSSASNKNNGLMGKARYQKLLKHYPKEQGKFPVSYHVAYIVVEK